MCGDFMNKNIENTFPDELKVRFAERLVEAMGKDNNLSFSKKCGISDSLLGRYIRGETFPTISKLQLISKASGRSMGWLLGEGDESGEHKSTSSLDKEELLKWWGLIFESLDDTEKQSIISTYQRFGVNALFADILATGVADGKEILRRGHSVESSNPTPEVSTRNKKAS